MAFSKNTNQNLTNFLEKADIEEQEESNTRIQITGSSPGKSLIQNQLVFHCQLAHGSPTGLISGFTSAKDLYQKIAGCYDISPDEILYCTVNTHKTDMTKLLAGQIGLNDFLFAHLKGRVKQIELAKSRQFLGITITDNSAGCVFIKRIKEDSIIGGNANISVGDHIQKINDQSLVGVRHYEAANILKRIPLGSTFILTLVEPLKGEFTDKSSRLEIKSKQSANDLPIKEIFRFKGELKPVHLEKTKEYGIEAINHLLETFIGISDSELALQIWELAEDKKNSMDFADAIDQSDLDAFGFSDELVIEFWGAITDVRQGRINQEKIIKYSSINDVI